MHPVLTITWSWPGCRPTLARGAKVGELRRAGFERAPSGDVYVREPGARTYVPLEEAHRRALLDGTVVLN